MLAAQASPPVPDFESALGVGEEFAALGIDVEIKVKSKTAPTAITSAFLKPTTTIVQLAVSGPKALKIKLEIDTDPPLGFNTEEQLLLQPYSFYVKCFSLPDLFAGKMHAVLFRQWGQRVIGRDWFDLEWYVRQGIPLHLDHLAERARQSGHWPGDQAFTAGTLQSLLTDRINSLDVGQAPGLPKSLIKGPFPSSSRLPEPASLGCRRPAHETLGGLSGSHLA